MSTLQKLDYLDWQYTEKPIENNEKQILTSMIGYIRYLRDIKNNNIPANTKYRSRLFKPVTLIDHIKLNHDGIDEYVYTEFIYPIIYPIYRKLYKKFKTNKPPSPPIVNNKNKKSKKLNKATKIRIQNSAKVIDSLVAGMYSKNMNVMEFRVIRYFKEIVDSLITRNKYKLYDSIISLSYSIPPKENKQTLYTYIRQFYQWVIDTNLFDIGKLFTQYDDLTVSCSYLNDYSPTFKPHSHQVDLYENIILDDNPKIIFLRAPTASGKTIGTIPLGTDKCVLFICPSRHVCVSASRYAVNMNLKVAVALGCSKRSDIKRQFNAKNRGYKDDSPMQPPIQFMVSDIHSAHFAMDWLKDNTNLQTIMVIDEPTIEADIGVTDLVKKTMKIIAECPYKKQVLMSATLPGKDELSVICDNFISKHPDGNIVEINSNVLGPGILAVNHDGEVVLPHHYVTSREELRELYQLLQDNCVLLKFATPKAVVNLYRNLDKDILPNDLHIRTYFNDLCKLNHHNIRQYYLELLQWLISLDGITFLDNKTRKLYPNTRLETFATTGAFSYTGGMSMVLSNEPATDIQKTIASLNVPDKMLQYLHKMKEQNDKIELSTKKLKQKLDKLNLPYDRQSAQLYLESERKEWQAEYDAIYTKLEYITSKQINLYIPSDYTINSKGHVEKYTSKTKDDFKSLRMPAISQSAIINVLNTQYADEEIPIYNGLLCGLGILDYDNTPEEYSKMAIELIEDANLYSVFCAYKLMFGTNYQFSHGILTDNMFDNSVDCLIQAIGRIGRPGVKTQSTIRSVDDRLFAKIFNPQSYVDRIEAQNMCEAFRIVVSDSYLE